VQIHISFINKGQVKHNNISIQGTCGRVADGRSRVKLKLTKYLTLGNHLIKSKEYLQIGTSLSTLCKEMNQPLRLKVHNGYLFLNVTITLESTQNNILCSIKYKWSIPLLVELNIPGFWEEIYLKKIKVRVTMKVEATKNKWSMNVHM
jgi:hypothetical protein